MAWPVSQGGTNPVKSTVNFNHHVSNIVLRGIPLVVGTGLKRIECYPCNLVTHIVSYEEVTKSFKFIKRIVTEVCAQFCGDIANSLREC